VEFRHHVILIEKTWTYVSFIAAVGRLIVAFPDSGPAGRHRVVPGRQHSTR